MCMANSLESRVPIADPRVVRFALHTRFDLKLRGGATKWILRRAVADVIPADVLSRRKVGFDTPAESWMRDRHPDFVRDLLLSKAARERGLLRRGRRGGAAATHHARPIGSTSSGSSRRSRPGRRRSSTRERPYANRSIMPTNRCATCVISDRSCTSWARKARLSRRLGDLAPRQPSRDRRSRPDRDGPKGVTRSLDGAPAVPGSDFRRRGGAAIASGRTRCAGCRSPPTGRCR